MLRARLAWPLAAIVGGVYGCTGTIAPTSEQGGGDEVDDVGADDPRYAFKTPLTEAERRKIFNGNARALYKL